MELTGFEYQTKQDQLSQVDSVLQIEISSRFIDFDYLLKGFFNCVQFFFLNWSANSFLVLTGRLQQLSQFNPNPLTILNNQKLSLPDLNVSNAI